jgi:hypothetical protein
LKPHTGTNDSAVNLLRNMAGSELPSSLVGATSVAML